MARVSDSLYEKRAIKFFRLALLRQTSLERVHFETLFEDLSEKADPDVREYFKDYNVSRRRKFFERRRRVFHIQAGFVSLKSAFQHWVDCLQLDGSDSVAVFSVPESAERTMVCSFLAILEHRGESHAFTLMAHLADSDSSLEPLVQTMDELDKWWFFEDRPRRFVIREDGFVIPASGTGLIRRFKSVEEKITELFQIILGSLGSTHYERLVHLVKDVSPEIDSYFLIPINKIGFFERCPAVFSTTAYGNVMLTSSTKDLPESIFPKASVLSGSKIAMKTTISIIKAYLHFLFQFLLPRKLMNVVNHFNLLHPNMQKLFGNGSFSSVIKFFKKHKEFIVMDDKSLSMKANFEAPNQDIIDTEDYIVKFALDVLKEHWRMDYNLLVSLVEKSNHEARMYFSHLSSKGKRMFFVLRTFYFHTMKSTMSISEGFLLYMERHFTNWSVAPVDVMQYLKDVLRRKTVSAETLIDDSFKSIAGDNTDFFAGFSKFVAANFFKCRCHEFVVGNDNMVSCLPRPESSDNETAACVVENGSAMTAMSVDNPAELNPVPPCDSKSDLALATSILVRYFSVRLAAGPEKYTKLAKVLNGFHPAVSRLFGYFLTADLKRFFDQRPEFHVSETGMVSVTSTIPNSWEWIDGGAIEETMVQLMVSAVREFGNMYVFQIVSLVQTRSHEAEGYFSHFSSVGHIWFFRSRPSHFVLASNHCLYLSHDCGSVQYLTDQQILHNSSLLLVINFFAHRLWFNGRTHYTTLAESLKDSFLNNRSYFQHYKLAEVLSFFEQYPSVFRVEEDGYVSLLGDTASNAHPVTSVSPPDQKPDEPVTNVFPSGQIPDGPVTSVSPPDQIPDGPVSSVSPPVQIPDGPVSSVSPPDQTPDEPVTSVSPPDQIPVVKNDEFATRSIVVRYFCRSAVKKSCDRIMKCLNFSHPNIVKMFGDCSRASVLNFFAACPQFSVAKGWIFVKSKKVISAGDCRCDLLDGAVMEDTVLQLAASALLMFGSMNLTDLLNYVRVWSFEGETYLSHFSQYGQCNFLCHSGRFEINSGEVSLPDGYCEYPFPRASENSSLLQVVLYFVHCLQSSKKPQTYLQLVERLQKSCLINKNYFKEKKPAEMRDLFKSLPSVFLLVDDHVSLVETDRRSRNASSAVGPNVRKSPALPKLPQTSEEIATCDPHMTASIIASYFMAPLRRQTLHTSKLLNYLNMSHPNVAKLFLSDSTTRRFFKGRPEFKIDPRGYVSANLSYKAPASDLEESVIQVAVSALREFGLLSNTALIKLVQSMSPTASLYFSHLSRTGIHWYFKQRSNHFTIDSKNIVSLSPDIDSGLSSQSASSSGISEVIGFLTNQLKTSPRMHYTSLVKRVDESNSFDIKRFFSGYTPEDMLNFFKSNSAFFILDQDGYISLHCKDTSDRARSIVVTLLTSKLEISGPTYYKSLMACLERSPSDFKDFFAGYTQDQQIQFFRDHPNDFFIADDGTVSIPLKNVSAPSSSMTRDQLAVEVTKILTSALQQCETGKMHYQYLAKCLLESSEATQHYFSRCSPCEIYTFFKQRPSDFHVHPDQGVSLPPSHSANEVSGMPQTNKEGVEMEIVSLLTSKLQSSPSLHYYILFQHLKETGGAKLVNHLHNRPLNLREMIKSIPDVLQIDSDGIVSLPGAKIAEKRLLSESRISAVIVLYLKKYGPLHLKILCHLTNEVRAFFEACYTANKLQFFTNRSRMFYVGDDHFIKLVDSVESAPCKSGEPGVTGIRGNVISHLRLVLREENREMKFEELRKVGISRLRGSKRNIRFKIRSFLLASSGYEIAQLLKTMPQAFVIHNGETVSLRGSCLNSTATTDISFVSSGQAGMDTSNGEPIIKRSTSESSSEIELGCVRNESLESEACASSPPICVISEVNCATNLPQPENPELPNSGSSSTSVDACSEVEIINGDQKPAFMDIMVDILPSFEEKPEENFSLSSNFTVMHIYSIRYCVSVLKVLNSIHYSLMKNVLAGDCHLSKFFGSFSLTDILEFFQIHSTYFQVDPNGFMSLKDPRIGAGAILVTPGELEDIQRSMESKAVGFFCDVLRCRSGSSTLYRLERTLNSSPAYVRSYFAANFSGDKLLTFFLSYSNYFDTDGKNCVSLKPGVPESTENSAWAGPGSTDQPLLVSRIKVEKSETPPASAKETAARRASVSSLSPCTPALPQPNGSVAPEDDVMIVSVVKPTLAKRHLSGEEPCQSFPTPPKRRSLPHKDTHGKASFSPVDLPDESKPNGIIQQLQSTGTYFTQAVSSFSSPGGNLPAVQKVDPCGTPLKSALLSAAQTFDVDLEKKSVEFFRNVLQVEAQPLSVSTLVSRATLAPANVKLYLCKKNDLSLFFYTHLEHFGIDQNERVFLR